MGNTHISGWTKCFGYCRFFLIYLWGGHLFLKWRLFVPKRTFLDFLWKFFKIDGTKFLDDDGLITECQVFFCLSKRGRGGATIFYCTGLVTVPGHCPGTVFSQVFNIDQPLLMTEFCQVTAPGQWKSKVGEFALYESKTSATRSSFSKDNFKFVCNQTTFLSFFSRSSTSLSSSMGGF